MTEVKSDASRIEAEIERLEAIQRELRAAEAEFAHRTRQVGDGLERLGGADPRLEGEMRALARNLKRNEAESKDLAGKLEKLKIQLAGIGGGTSAGCG